MMNQYMYLSRGKLKAPMKKIAQERRVTRAFDRNLGNKKKVLFVTSFSNSIEKDLGGRIEKNF